MARGVDGINDIPRDKKVILFRNTGSLSAQAAFALRVAGRDNVLVLQTELDGWIRMLPTNREKGLKGQGHERCLS